VGNNVNNRENMSFGGGFSRTASSHGLYDHHRAPSFRELHAALIDAGGN
jgi:hypothetical protein